MHLRQRHSRVIRFRGGLVFKAHTPRHHSTLGSRVIKEQKKRTLTVPAEENAASPAETLARDCKARTMFVSWLFQFRRTTLATAFQLFLSRSVALGRYLQREETVPQQPAIGQACGGERGRGRGREKRERDNRSTSPSTPTRRPTGLLSIPGRDSATAACNWSSVWGRGGVILPSWVSIA